MGNPSVPYARARSFPTRDELKSWTVEKLDDGTASGPRVRTEAWCPSDTDVDHQDCRESPGLSAQGPLIARGDQRDGPDLVVPTSPSDTLDRPRWSCTRADSHFGAAHPLSSVGWAEAGANGNARPTIENPHGSIGFRALRPTGAAT